MDLSGWVGVWLGGNCDCRCGILYAISMMYLSHFGTGQAASVMTTLFDKIQKDLVLRRGYVLQYLVVNRIVVKRGKFIGFKLRQVHGPNKLVK